MKERANLMVGVLGPLEVHSDGRSITVPAGRARTLLAVLALTPGRPVTMDALASRLWGDDTPKFSRNALHSYAMRLRRLLGEDVIATAKSGYLLNVAAEHVDLWQFRGLVREAAEADDPLAQRESLGHALRLWRGEPLADSQSEVMARDDIPSLVEERLAAVETRVDLDLELGNSAGVISELQLLVAVHPLRESIWTRLIRALHLSGRSAEATQAYHALRASLNEHLGVNPSAPLQTLYRQLLSEGEEPPEAPVRENVGAPPQVRVPFRQLPSDITPFVGRRSELAALDRILGDGSQESGAPTRLAVVVGGAGIGKTAFAVHWAHQVNDQFPDGQVYVNLRGYGPSAAIAPAEALDALLRVAGVATEYVPDDVEARAAALRSSLAGQRLLILLDNARDAEQVRPLLPGSGCFVLVTSRNQLRGLTAFNGAHRVTLGRLGQDEAVALLAAGAHQLPSAVHHEAFDDVVELCDRLPLALRIAAERIGRRSDLNDVRELAEELRDEHRRLDALGSEDPMTDLRAVLSWSYLNLDDESARLFQLLGLHVCSDISLPAAAALTGLPLADLRRPIDRLVNVHLLDQNRHGRYEFHDLLAAYAAEQVKLTRPARERDAAIDRVLTWYLHTAHAAHRMLHPSGRADLVALPAPEIVPLAFSGYQQARAWFEAEHDTLIAAVRYADDRNCHETTWQLSLALLPYLRIYRPRIECLEIATIALRSAERAGSLRGQFHAANALAMDREEADQPPGLREPGVASGRDPTLGAMHCERSRVR